MHARLNYVDMDPARFDEIDPFWRGVVEGYEDLVCGYFLREGESPHTLSVVVFRSEAAMRANTERSLGDVVKQAAALRLGEPVLHPLEVCAQVPPEGSAAPACARVAKAGLVPERAEEFIAGWPGGMAPYREESGFHSAILCCERPTGEVTLHHILGLARGSRRERAKRRLRERGGSLPGDDEGPSGARVLERAHHGQARGRSMLMEGSRH